nr:MAG TPA: hypothetical protein [Caudoviricetes sp.]
MFTGPSLIIFHLLTISPKLFQNSSTFHNRPIKSLQGDFILPMCLCVQIAKLRLWECII